MSHNRLSGHLPLCLGDMHQSLRLDFKGNPDFDGLTVSSVTTLKEDNSDRINESMIFFVNFSWFVMHLVLFLKFQFPVLSACVCCRVFE